SDLNERLGDGRPLLLNAHAPTTTEQYYFHRIPRRCSDHVNFWYGDDELSPPLPHEGFLLDDLRLEVPRQDQHVVGPRLADALGRADRDACPGQEVALLLRVPVDGVVDEIAADPAVVEQGVALA